MMNRYKKSLSAITASEESKQRAINEFVRLNNTNMAIKQKSDRPRIGLWKFAAVFTMACLLVVGIFGVVLLRGIGNNETEVLSAPSNIVAETETKKLTWSAVENSVGYVLLFDNGTYIEVNENYFSYEHFGGGVYSFRVMAKGNGILFSNSDWSESKTFTVVETLLAPKNVLIVNSVLKWDEVEFSSGYTVQIDTETVSLSSNQTSYSLAYLTAGYYDIKIKTVGNGHTFLDSDFTTAVNYMAVRQLKTPVNLKYDAEQRIITWDEVDNADQYLVSITVERSQDNGWESHGTSRWVTNASFALDQLSNLFVDEWWNYKITVLATSNLPIYNASDKSPELAFAFGEPGMHFKRVNNDTAYELAYCAQSVNGQKLEHVIIPAYYNGKSVIGLGINAFRATGLGSHPAKYVEIPDTVTYIDSLAFSGASIEKIVIPKSVTEIGSWAFVELSNLTEVYFGGDETEWNAITIGMGNDELINTQRFYYSETEVLDGSHWRFVNGLPVVWG